MGDFDFKTTSFEFKGFKEMYKTLDHLSEGVKAKALAPMLLEAVEPIRDTARAIAPDDPLTSPPWNLPTSIEKSDRQRSGRAKRDRALGRFDARAYVGPTGVGYPQAIMQEFGTIHHVAQPYMRPAWNAQKQNVLNLLKAIFAKHIRAIVAKHGVKT